MMSNTPYIMLTGAIAVGAGTPVYCKDAKSIVFTVATLGLTTGKSFNLQCYGSAEETLPNTANPPSITNLIDTIQMIRVRDGAQIDGATGDLFSANDDVRIYEVNVSGLTWVVPFISSLVSGSGVTILAKGMLYDPHNG